MCRPSASAFRCAAHAPAAAWTPGQNVLQPRICQRCLSLQERGGVVQGALSADTTHVVATSIKEDFAETEEHLEECFRPPSQAGNAASAEAAAARRAAADSAHFVTTDWISDSVQQDARQDEARFAAVASQRAARAAAAPKGGQTASQPEPVTLPAAPQPAAQQQLGSECNATLEQQHDDRSSADVDAQVHAAAAVMIPDAALTPVEGASCEATIPGWGADSWQPHAWTSAHWGEGGVWLEPFDRDKVTATLLQLYRHQNRLDLRESTPDVPASAGAAEPGSPLALRGAASLDALSPQGEALAGSSPGAAAIEAECGHVACACAGTCIIAEMEKTTQLYVRGRGADVHKMRATQGAIATLRHVQQPLRTATDVDALGLGAAPCACAFPCGVNYRCRQHCRKRIT